MKITRRMPPDNWEPYVGLLTNQGVIEDFSDIEIEKGYLTAKRLWKTPRGYFYASEMKPLVLFELVDLPIEQGTYFIAPDTVYPQVADEVLEHSIKHKLINYYGLPVDDRIFTASKYESYRVSVSNIRDFTESELEQVMLMDWGDVIEL